MSIMRGGVCAGLDSCRPHVAGTGQGRAPGARGPPPRPRSWRIRRSPAHSSPSWMRGHREPGPQLITVECRFRWSMALSIPWRIRGECSIGHHFAGSGIGEVRQIRRSRPSPVPARAGSAVLRSCSVRSCRVAFVLVSAVVGALSCIGAGWAVSVHCGLDPGRFPVFPQVTASAVAAWRRSSPRGLFPVWIMFGGFSAGLGGCQAAPASWVGRVRLRYRASAAARPAVVDRWLSASSPVASSTAAVVSQVVSWVHRVTAV